MLTLGFELELPTDHDDAIAQVTSALSTEGFGVVSRHDMHTTFREKLGVDFHPYTILGVCQPSLAHRALQREPGIGLMLPCNVTVEETPAGSTRVRIANPDGVMAVGDYHEDPELRTIASEARTRLERVMDSLDPAT